MKHSFSNLLCLVCAGALALTLAGCSFFRGEEASSSSAFSQSSSYDYENFNYSQGLDENGYWTGIHALDFVTLPEDFASIQVVRSDVEPSVEDVQAQIDYLLEMSADTVQITDRAAVLGDTVNIDYSGSVDGVAFSGGTASGYDLALGSDTFIEGFETQIVGHTPGETFDITVTFPENYGNSTDASGNLVELSGREAVFAITLNCIQQTILPELTDAWVDAQFGESDGLHSVTELYQFFSDLLYEHNMDEYIMGYLQANSTFLEIPQALSDYQATQCLNYYYTTASYYGYGLEEFVQGFLGYDSPDAMLADISEDLTSYCQEALIYQAVAETLDVAPSEESMEEYAAYVSTYGENYCRMVALMDAVNETLRTGAQLV